MSSQTTIASRIRFGGSPADTDEALLTDLTERFSTLPDEEADVDAIELALDHVESVPEAIAALEALSARDADICVRELVVEVRR